MNYSLNLQELQHARRIASLCGTVNVFAATLVVSFPKLGGLAGSHLELPARSVSSS
jgi:hypothetical protein